MNLWDFLLGERTIAVEGEKFKGYGSLHKLLMQCPIKFFGNTHS